MLGLIAALIFAASLCADCFAVSACSSVTLKSVTGRRILLVAIVFAIVQTAFLAGGWFFGDLFVGYIHKVARIIGFLLLLYVGGSMVLEAVRKKEGEPHDLNGLKNIFIGAVATSIDALAVGISLSMDGESAGDVAMKSAAVFLVTFLSVVLGIRGGVLAGRKFGRPAELVGGLVLIGIGVGILLGSPSRAAEEEDGPVPVCHLLICCRSANSGTTFLVNGEWNPAHDYRDIDQVRDILQKVKDAGVNVVSVDFTNPPEWEMGEGGLIHQGRGDGLNWPGYGKMLDNIVTVCHEKDMQFIIFIGNPAAWTMKYWNTVAGFVWERYAQDPAYRRYGFGDDRPLMVVFYPGDLFWPLWERTPDEEKDNLAKFRLGTCQVNDPIEPYPSDGWGYRSTSESSDGTVRFACPNAGVPPTDWARIGATEWKERVDWALGATDYAVFGSYDDTCDGIHWGICDVSESKRPYHINQTTVDDPFIYYNILKEALSHRNR